MAKELEERKLALQRKFALHKANLSQDKVSAEQTKERKLAARNKAEAMAEKRKLEAASDNAFDSSEDSSGSDESESDIVEPGRDSKVANTFGAPTAGTPKKSKKQLEKPSKKKKRARM